MRIALVLPLAWVLVTAVSSCKRPGTDRDLQCERFGDLMLERQIECGDNKIDGVALTASNAPELAAKAKAACMADVGLNPSAACIKAVAAAPCVGDRPDVAALLVCKKK